MGDNTVDQILSEFGKDKVSKPKELFHFGVKGMKWGVRRSRSALALGSGPQPVKVSSLPGRKAVATGGARHYPSEEAKKTTATVQLARASSLHAVTNADLKAAVDRMNLEQQFIRLNAQAQPKRAGREFIKKLMGDIAREEVSNLAKGKKTRFIGPLLGDSGGKHRAK